MEQIPGQTDRQPGLHRGKQKAFARGVSQHGLEGKQRGERHPRNEPGTWHYGIKRLRVGVEGWQGGTEVGSEEM